MNYPTHRNRSAFTMIEVVISAAMLITVMSFFTTLVYRVDLVWKDIAQQRLAITELSNQLDRLSVMPMSEVESQIQSLQPSEEAIQSLPSPIIFGELTNDEFGTRLTLRLSWTTKHPSKGVELSTWMMESSL